MKSILVTAGPVGAPLDDNKYVTNRARGLWAGHFAQYLVDKGHNVTLLLPESVRGPAGHDTFKVVYHKGFAEYMDFCRLGVYNYDAAVMAAAVTNWLPTHKIPGKMPTKGYAIGDTIKVEFELVPRVIDSMRLRNPELTLIGCKMLSGATHEELVEAAYEGVLVSAHCNVVLANDLQDLHTKHLVYADRSVHTYKDDWEGLYAALEATINDEHYSTTFSNPWRSMNNGKFNQEQFPEECKLFDRIVEQNRDRFTKVGSNRVFGAVAVKTPTGWLCSPREKGQAFTSSDASLVTEMVTSLADPVLAQPPFVDYQKDPPYINVEGFNAKACLNAPLMIRYGLLTGAKAVLHLHEFIEGVPTLPYAPPGTVRDNDRVIPTEALTNGFNVEGHGFYLPIREKD